MTTAPIYHVSGEPIGPIQGTVFDISATEPWDLPPITVVPSFQAPLYNNEVDC